jgi:hypothetical protein
MHDRGWSKIVGVVLPSFFIIATIDSLELVGALDAVWVSDEILLDIILRLYKLLF